MMSEGLKRVAHLSIPVVACLLAMPAFSQTPAPAAATSERTPRSATLDEVVVTARRREESMQESPVAVTALSADALRESGITNFTQLTESVPSLQVVKGQSNQVFIRGIGQRDSSVKVDPAVGFYIDSIFLPRPDGQFLDTLEIDSVQVLRGPQGTLFGKNNTGGAVVFTMAKPHHEFEAFLEGSLGNFNEQSFRAGANAPVTDNLFARVGVSSINNDGYLRDISQQRDNNSDGRMAFVGQLRWEASDDLTVDFLSYYGRTRERFAANNCRVINEDAILINGLGLLWAGDTDPSNPSAFIDSCNDNNRDFLPDLTTNMGPNAMNYELDSYLVGLTTDWAIDENHSLKFVASYANQLKGSPLLRSDSDSGTGQFVQVFYSDDSKRDNFSLELQFTGAAFDSRLNYTTGLFGMVERNTEQTTQLSALVGLDAVSAGELAGGMLVPELDFSLIPSLPGGSAPLVGPVLGPPILQLDFDLENTTLAAFFQGSWDFTDSLQLTLGLRYTAEIREAGLRTTTSDPDATAARITASPFFSPVLDPDTGLHAYLGPGRWADDPVGIAMALFPDNTGDGYFNFPLAHDRAVQETQKATFEKLTPMASLAYVVPEEWLFDSFLDTAMVYGTWSTGFKSGFFEPRGIDGLQRIEQEEVINREIGFKLDAFQRSVRLNAALYSMIFKNMQLVQVSTDSNGQLAVVFTNAGEATIEGGELELTWLPMPAMLITFSYSQNRYRFNKFEELDIFALIEGREEFIDRSDETLPVSPEKTAALGMQYSIDTSVGVFTPRLDVNYKDNIYLGFDRGSWLLRQQDKSLTDAPAFTLVHARLSWMNNDGDLSVGVYARNLLDKRYLIGAVSIGDTIGTFNEIVGQPRTYGLEVRKTF